MNRSRRRPRIGLVLGGGAARGWAHIGVLRALQEAGIKPDVVCGTSIGALVGAVYANGDLDWLEHWVSRLTWQTVVRLLDVRVSGGILGGKKVIEVFSNRFSDRAIPDLPVSFAAVATELDTGREVWLQEGSVIDAVRASIAIPGIFPPVWRDGVWLVDGGLSNPVPVSVARALRSDCVIAIDLNNDILSDRDFGATIPSSPRSDVAVPRSPALWRNGKLWPRWLAPTPERVSPDVRTPPAPSIRVPSVLSSVGQSIDIMHVRITRSRLAGEPADILIQPRLGGMRIFDFHRAGAAIAEGRTAVGRMMPEIRARLGLDDS